MGKFHKMGPGVPETHLTREDGVRYMVNIGLKFVNAKLSGRELVLDDVFPAEVDGEKGRYILVVHWEKPDA